MTDLHLHHLEHVDPDLNKAGDSLCRAVKSLSLGQRHPSGVGHLKVADALVAIQRAQIRIAEARELTGKAIEQIEAALAEPVLEAAE